MEDNKKHKRSLSSPIFYLREYGNLSTSTERKRISHSGIFSPRRRQTFNREAMAGAVSDDPSMSRTRNGMLLNGSPFLVNGTDSELEGIPHGHSAIQLHHGHSVIHENRLELNSNDPGMYNEHFTILAIL